MKNLTKKIGIIVLIVGFFVGLVFLVVSRSDSDDNHEENKEVDYTALSETDFLVKNDDLFEDYEYMNTHEGLEGMREELFAIVEDGVLVVNVSEYCDWVQRSEFVCADGVPIERIYGNLVGSYDSKTILFIASEYAVSPKAGKIAAENYLKDREKNKDLYRCTGNAMLYTPDYSKFVFGSIAERNGEKSVEDLYKVLDNIKERTGMEYLYRCDELNK